MAGRGGNELQTEERAAISGCTDDDGDGGGLEFGLRYSFLSKTAHKTITTGISNRFKAQEQCLSTSTASVRLGINATLSLELHRMDEHRSSLH